MVAAVALVVGRTGQLSVHISLVLESCGIIRVLGDLVIHPDRQLTAMGAETILKGVIGQSVG